MKLHISKKTSIHELQKQFSDIYPFLKIELYNKPHAEKKLSSAKDKMSSGEIISASKNFKKTGAIDISQDRTVAELEKDFHDMFGIAMQVSRRNGSIWIETSLTDNRTLEMQNQQGMMASTPV